MQPKYLIFTNIFVRYRKYQNSNPFKVYHAYTKEEAKAIIDSVVSRGYCVTKTTTRLGTPVTM